MAGASLRQYGMGSGVAMAAVWTAGEADVLKGAQAIFEYRKRSVSAKDPRDAHPMFYASYTWDKLPISEQVYYCEMSVANFRSFGITTPDVALVKEG